MDGYSGSDVRLVCKEAAMRPVRKIFDALESHQEGNDAHTYRRIKPTFLSGVPECNTRLSFTGDADMPAIRLETVTTADFLEVIAHTKPSARNLMDRYVAWEREYESV